MIFDGKKLAAEILAQTKTRAESLAHPPRILAVVANETAATKSYLKIKEARAAEAGCALEILRVETEGIHNNLLSRKMRDSIKIAAEHADAVIVQLPLPFGMNQQEICDAIPLDKDADILSSASRSALTPGVNASSQTPGVGALLLPPVVGAVMEILKYGKVEIKNKKAVVVGNGFLVGAPVAMWLKQQGAIVEILDINTPLEKFTAALRAADIIISGAGSQAIIKPEMINEGMVLIDAGTSESSGIIVGDADPACASKCSIFTPVPGGIGPIAVAKLFENAVLLAERNQPQGVALR